MLNELSRKEVMVYELLLLLQPPPEAKQGGRVFVVRVRDVWRGESGRVELRVRKGQFERVVFLGEQIKAWSRKIQQQREKKYKIVLSLPLRSGGVGGGRWSSGLYCNCGRTLVFSVLTSSMASSLGMAGGRGHMTARASSTCISRL